MKPLGNNVLIKEIEEKKETATKSGILLTTPTNPNDCRKGIVIAQGTDCIEELTDCTVIYTYGDRFDIEGETHFIVKEENILAVIED